MLNERRQSPKTRNYRTHLFTCPEYTSLETEVNLVLLRARGDGELSSHSYEVWRFLAGNVLRLAWQCTPITLASGVKAEGPGIQGHTQLHSKLKVILDYKRVCL